MKQIIRFRWPIAILWIIATAGLLFLAPDLQELVREKGQITIPEQYPSQKAARLIDKMDDDGVRQKENAVLVFHDKKKLGEAEKDEVVRAIDQLKEHKEELAISNIVAFRDDPAIEEQTVSKDETTIIIPFQVSLENQEIEESREKIYETLRDIEVDHYLTGERYIEQDIITNSEKGLKKTEKITIVLILIILFIVFRSFVAPFIPLLTVGISYLAAQGIVAILANTMNFPLSTYTQIFMVAVMFGIGTDYCILIISRFKEELANYDSVKEAVIKTYQASGKTILYASLAVLIGFSTIGLSTFSLYQSAVAVGVGVAVVVIALFTLVPFFLLLLGKKLFWPFDRQVNHKESKLWGKVGTFAWSRPLLSLLIVAIIIVPPLLLYDGTKSYNSLEEIGDDYESVIGFNKIADSFGPGQTMPTTILLETDQQISSVNDYQDIETITQELSKMDGIKEVRSATRPTGEVIEEFLVDEQSKILADGINQSLDGIKEIEDALREATTEIDEAVPQLSDAKDGLQQLMEGTDEAKSGVEDISSALEEIQTGIQSGTQGIDDIKESLQLIQNSLNELTTSNKQLLEGYEAIAEGLEDFGGGRSIDANELDQLVETLESAKEQMETVFHTAVATNPDLQEDPNFLEAYMTAEGQIGGVIDGITDMKGQLQELAKAQGQLQEQVINPLNQLNEGLSESINAQQQLAEGIDELISGVDELKSGLNQASDGQGEVVNHTSNVTDGLAEIYGGQEELTSAFDEMKDGLETLSDGLADGSDGLQEIDTGLSDIVVYLDDIQFDKENPIVIIPEEALTDEDFIDGTKPYISDDQMITKFDVVLEDNPYSSEAIQMIEHIEQKANNAKQGTIFAESSPKIGGISSMNHDLQQMSDDDFYRTVVFMIIGIFIILVILLRSIIIPTYLIGSLVLTYFTSMGITEIIFVNIAGFDGLTWAAPFFTFVILIALGIDYSIFLMDRFNEYHHLGIKEGLLKAMKNMGTVIISAAVILGGTFAAMLPSGVLSLLQIATAVITGLFLYAFVMLPLFVPTMVKLFGNKNWWPFKR